MVAHTVADLFGENLPAPRVTRFGSLPALSFAPVHHGLVKIFVKRCMDVAGAAALLLIVSPFLFAAALAIRASSSGPILFRQIRCGLNGRRFVMHKLRTMYVDAEERKRELMDQNEMNGAIFKIKDDPRVTAVGRFLRKTSIDELPQFWNVLMGQMSLVGTRPPTPSEVAEYENWHHRRTSIKPGITGMWQISGRNQINGFDEIVRLDLQYIDTWTLWLDIKILLKTVWVVFKRDGSS